MPHSHYSSDMTKKLCHVCQQWRNRDDFYTHWKASKRSDGRLNTCKTCSARRAIEWRAVNRKRWNKSRTFKSLEKTLGISQNQYDALISLYPECPACGRTEGVRGHSLAVDHCHTTGVIRGMLCPECNLALGNIRDSVETLYRLIFYLETVDTRHGVLLQAVRERNELSRRQRMFTF